jgi:hypothetical protein
MEITENIVVKFYCNKSKCEHPHECEITLGYLPVFPECPFCIGRVRCPCTKEEDTDKDSDAYVGDIRRANRCIRKVQRIKADNFFVQVEDVDWDSLLNGVYRAGCIPYTVINKKIHFCLGLDNFHREYCDFGGRKEPKDATHLTTAVREFREESREIFNQEAYNLAFIQKQMCLLPYKKFNHVLIFVEVPPDKFANTNAEFTRLGTERKLSTSREMVMIRWIDEKEFQNIFFSKLQTTINTWDFVRKHLLELGISYRLFRGRLIHKTRSHYRR